MNKLPDKFSEYWIPEPNSGCWLWTKATSKAGYGYIRIGRKVLRAHRVSWEFYNGAIPDGLIVCHKCDTRSCINPQHLFLGTYQDNAKDAINKGRMSAHPPISRGEANGLTKLSNSEVLAIRSSSQRRGELARFFGVSKVTITRIRNGTTWSWLQ